MSINDLVAAAAEHPLAILLTLGPLPVLAWIVGRISGTEGERPPWNYLYSALVYAACVPGILAGILTAYALFFLRANLLEVNVLVYGLPIVVMAVTLALIGRRVSFAEIPGFDRLGGLMLIIGVSLAAALFVVKTRIWIVFGSSLATLCLIAIAAFALLRWGSRKMFDGRTGEP